MLTPNTSTSLLFWVGLRLIDLYCSFCLLCASVLEMFMLYCMSMLTCSALSFLHCCLYLEYAFSLLAASSLAIISSCHAAIISACCSSPCVVVPYTLIKYDDLHESLGFLRLSSRSAFHSNLVASDPQLLPDRFSALSDSLLSLERCYIIIFFSGFMRRSRARPAPRTASFHKRSKPLLWRLCDAITLSV